LVKQNVAGIDLVDHVAGFIDNLDIAVQSGMLIAQKGLAKADGFLPGGLDIRQFPAPAVAGQDGAFADVEIIAGHGVGFAGLLFR